MPEEWEALARRADALKDRDDVKGNYQALAAACLDRVPAPKLCEHAQIQWRIGRALYDMGLETTDRAERRRQLERGLEFARRAVAQDDANFAAHKWCGILLGAVGDFLPTKEKIANAYVIRDHFARAIELSARRDSTSLHAWGAWCFEMSKLSWFEVQAATLLFGTPPRCTTAEALAALVESNAIDRTVYNSALAGDVHASERRWGDAATWYRNAAELPIVTESQRRQRDAALEKLAAAAAKV